MHEWDDVVNAFHCPDCDLTRIEPLPVLLTQCLMCNRDLTEYETMTLVTAVSTIQQGAN